MYYRCVWIIGIALCIILFLYLYQDVYVSSKDFEPAISLIGRPHFTISTGHSKVFIPQTMVELDEPTKGSDISAKSTPCTTDQLKEAGVDYEESRRAALEYEKQKAAAALAKDLGPEVAKETNIDEQVKALEQFTKAKQQEDNTAADRGVPTSEPSAYRQYPAVQPNCSQQSSQLCRQSGSTHNPNQFSAENNQSGGTYDPYHGQPRPVSRQGDWMQHVGVGSTVMVPNINPPMYGIIRWIGTMPQVQGYVAGVELVSGVYIYIQRYVLYNCLYLHRKHHWMGVLMVYGYKIGHVILLVSQIEVISACWSIWCLIKGLHLTARVAIVSYVIFILTGGFCITDYQNSNLQLCNYGKTC